jgi:hypothetical protein
MSLESSALETQSTIRYCAFAFAMVKRPLLHFPISCERLVRLFSHRAQPLITSNNCAARRSLLACLHSAAAGRESHGHRKMHFIYTCTCAAVTSIASKYTRRLYWSRGHAQPATGSDVCVLLLLTAVRLQNSRIQTRQSEKVSALSAKRLE